MKGFMISLVCSLFSTRGFTQNETGINALPVNIVPGNSDSTKPLVFYMTGDGGWNKFSQLLAQGLAAKGYPVVSLNSYKYFWQKKTPQQNAADISTLVTTYQKLWHRNKILLIGYSFGADVLPFAYPFLPHELKAQVKNITLLSPSSTTDFEVHLLAMLGKKEAGRSVPAAINNITDKPLTIVFGEGEDEYRQGELTGKNLVRVTLPGGHHYDGNEAEVVNTVIQHIPKQ